MGFAISKKLRLAIVSCCLILCAEYSFAATERRYISDELTAYIRKGPGSSFGIKKGLKPGARVTLTGTSTADGWLEVKAGTVTGWMPKSVLSKSKTAKQRLVEVEKSIARYKAENGRLKKERDSVKAENKAAQNDKGNLARNYKELKRKFEEVQRVSRRTVEINQANEALETELQVVKTENDRLKLHNQQLTKNESRQWFVIGAAVLFAGMVLGLIIPKIRFKKSSSWSEL